jgi:hypothetical protein
MSLTQVMIRGKLQESKKIPLKNHIIVTCDRVVIFISQLCQKVIQMVMGFDRTNFDKNICFGKLQFHILYFLKYLFNFRLDYKEFCEMIHGDKITME